MAPILVPFYKLLKKVIKMSIKNKQVESKIQKSFKFGETTYQNNAASLGKLTKAVKVAPARLSQAIDWLVSAAIEQTQWNQTAPLQQASTMLVFSDKAVLKKAGQKLLAYCKAELVTIELIEIKNTETVKVKYLAEEGKRNLPAELPPFSGWEPADTTKAPRAVTEKAIESLQKAFTERQRYLLADEDTEEKADEERAILEASLINMLLELVPVTELVKRVSDTTEEVDMLTDELTRHRDAILAAHQEKFEKDHWGEDSLIGSLEFMDEPKLTTVEEEVAQEKAKLKAKPKAKATATGKEVA